MVTNHTVQGTSIVLSMISQRNFTKGLLLTEENFIWKKLKKYRGVSPSIKWTIFEKKILLWKIKMLQYHKAHNFIAMHEFYNL